MFVLRNFESSKKVNLFLEWAFANKANKFFQIKFELSLRVEAKGIFDSLNKSIYGSIMTSIVLLA